MFKNNFIVKILIVFLFAAGLSSQAVSAFKTSRIGGTKGLVTTPTKDLIASLNTKLSAFDNSTLNSLLTSSSSTWLTNADIKDLNLDLSSFGGYPLDAHELAYLTHKLATAINAGTLTLGTSQASLQDAITNNVLNTCSSTTACNESSADWVHGQVSDDNFTTTSLVNLITPSLLDDLISGDSNYVAGYTSKVLNAKSSVSISDVRSDPFFQAIANPSGTSLPSASEIMNAINRIAGFVEAADDSNITSGEYSTAQTVVNAFLDNSDNGNFTSANFLSCYNNTETARSGGADTCNKTSSAWASQSSILANFETYKQNITDNTTVTAANLTGIGLSLSQLGTPVEDWKIDYLNTLLSDNASLISDWQTTINSFNIQTAALWKIDKVASGATGHSDSDINNLILDSAIGSSFSSSTLLGTNSSATAAGFAGTSSFDNLTSPSNTSSNVKSYLLTYAGYTSAQYTAWDANSDKANFTSTNFVACYDNAETARSGGANACTKTAAQWTTNSSQLTYFTEAKTKISNGETLTEANLTNIGLTVSSLGSPVTSLALEYMSNTLDNTSTLTSDWQTAIDAYTVSTGSLWKIGRIATGVETATSGLTETLIDDAIGNSFSTSSVLGANSAKSITTARTAVTSSGLTTSSNASAVKTWITGHAGFTSSAAYTAWNSNSDKSNFSVANFNTCYSDTDSHTGGANTCNITYSSWNSKNAFITAADAGTLSTGHLDNLSISYSSLGSNPLDAYILDYIENQVDTSEDVSDWSTDIGAITKAAAARYKIGQVAGDDNTTHPKTDITLALFDAALGASSGGTQNLLSFGSKNLTQLQNNIDGSSLGSNPTASALNTHIANFVGMSSGDSAQQYAANSDAAAFNKYDWQACMDSSNSGTGGANKCTPTFSNWIGLNITDINQFKLAVRGIYDEYNAHKADINTTEIRKGGKMVFYCRQMYLFCQISTTISTHTSNATLQKWMTCSDYFGATEGLLMRGDHLTSPQSTRCNNGSIQNYHYPSQYPYAAVTGFNSGCSVNHNHGDYSNKVCLGRP